MISRWLIKRQFHQSVSPFAKFYPVVIGRGEASKPVPFPPSVQLRVHRIPPSTFPPLCPHDKYTYAELVEHKLSLRKFRESSVFYKQMAQEQAVVEVRGPLGVGYVPIPEWLDLHLSRSAINSSTNESNSDMVSVDMWHGQGAIGGPADFSETVYSSHTLLPPIADEDRYLHVSCVDPEHRLQARHWGFYRRRIANYVTAVTEGVTLPIRLVGVGYRAQVDPLQIRGPEKGDCHMFERFIRRWDYNIRKSAMRMYLATRFPDSLWGQMWASRRLLNHDICKHFTHTFPDAKALVSPTLLSPTAEEPLGYKLVAKLGYAHSVEICIPSVMKVSVPNPARILITGVHLAPMQEFAFRLRKYRPPEPYKGKGVFVGAETITLKEKKVK